MSLLKRLGGPPQPNDPAPASSAVAQPPPPAEARGSLMGGGMAAPPPLPPEVIARPSLEQRVMSPIGAISGAGDVSQQRILELSLWVVDRIQGSLGNQTELKRTPESERLLQERFTNYYRQSGVNLTDPQVKQLYEMVNDELFGFGPIEPLLRDDTVTEVMVNGPNTVYIQQRGKVNTTSIRFSNDEHVLKVIDRIIRP